MSSRGPRAASSSRDVSPESRPEPYDPFYSASDPIELAHLSQPSLDARDSHDARGRSPDEISRGRLHPRLHFGLSRTSGEYAPVSERNDSPKPATQSGTESTYTLNSLYQTKAMDADTQALVDRRAGEVAQWRVHWTTPAIIVSLFIAGVVAAMGHHFFYTHLNGRPAVEQLKMVRYGTALAFFVKSTLVGTVIVCNRQRIWYTFRRKAMTINGIDGLFSATEDPTQFFLNWEMIRNGKLATLMAACTWLIPIASVLSPASLTSEVRTWVNATTCFDVANLNFAHESSYNFRDTSENHGISVSYYNTTDLAGKSEGYFDYYDQPSKNARRLAFSAAYLKSPQPRKGAAVTFCGDVWNCTYTINFQGPGYKCDDISDSDIPEAPFKLDQIAPNGNFTYLAEVDQGTYGVQNAPLEPPYPDSLGVLESEPILWIGYAHKTTELYGDDDPKAKKWKYIHVPKMFKCVMYHTNYTYEMQYTPSQAAILNERDFLRPLIDTTLQPNPDNGSGWIASPSSNFISPKDDPDNYKLTSAYHSMGALLRTFLRGNIEKTTDTFTITRSDISETRLINGRNSYPLSNLTEEIQHLFEDMLITLLSEPTLVLAEKQDLPCEKTRNVVVFVYYPQSLWIGYAAVIAITSAFILVGAWSLCQNGVASDVLFSRIMVTTRNPTLDHLSVGACLGGDPFPRDLVKTKLRFGVLLEDEPREGPLGRVEHVCFGTLGETKEIVKGGTYAGLKKWRKDNREAAGGHEEKAPLLEKSSRC
ncbi:hypothetical protein EJ02DRAFT_61132 [Clathrospora elynae]|uniref:Formylmethionine deformylase-like protein n=1 Tax=Clathrospora elynae TaxID=706981 RepID=A0A6A5T8E9_9PLEO|nr:hypothetical protein EJ02DRAFT_61132 [Clathrospora elynae]